MPDINLNLSRTIFKEFKHLIERDTQLREEMERALASVLAAYNTAVHENRFVVGGIVEHIIVAAFNGTNVLRAKHIGKFHQRLDMEVRGERNEHEPAFYSMKGIFTRNSGTRLVNTLGSSDSAEWNEPTIFVLSGVGLIYTDAMLLPHATSRSGDALTISRHALNGFIEDKPKWVLGMAIPYKRQDENLQDSRTASEDLAKELLSQGYQRLRLD